MHATDPKQPRAARLLTEDEAAERLRVSRRSVKLLRLSGQLAYIRGRPARIDEADLEDYIASLRVLATARHGDAEPKPKLRSIAAAQAQEEADNAEKTRIMHERIKKNALRRYMKSRGQ